MALFRVSEETLSKERKHYRAIRSLADSRYETIDYLYNRLNIVDAKTSTLLTVNGLLFAVDTFLLGIIVHTGDKGPIALAANACGPHIDRLIVWIIFVGGALLVLSTFCCFPIFHLRFDYIVKSDDLHAAGGEKDDALGKMLSQTALGYGEASLSAQTARGTGRVADYEERFFAITNKRQSLLTTASRFAAAAGVTVGAAFLWFTMTLLVC